jgi:hypothetical protein
MCASRRNPQVMTNLESQRRQYDLVDVARQSRPLPEGYGSRGSVQAAQVRFELMGENDWIAPIAFLEIQPYSIRLDLRHCHPQFVAPRQ